MSICATTWPILGTTLVNVACGVGIILGSKHLYTTWPYPVAAAALQQTMLLVYTYEREHDVPWHITNYLAFTNAGQVALSNMMLRLCTLGVYELITALRVPALLLVQWYQFRVAEPRRPALCAMATAIFAAVGTLGSTRTANASGVAAGLLAVATAAASKSVIKGYTMQYKANTDGLLRAQLPGTIAILVAYSAVVEQPTYPDLITAVRVMVLGILAIVLNVTAFRLCGHSPMYYQQLSPFKTGLIVGMSNSWGDSLRAASIIGTTLFASLYMHFRDRTCWDTAPSRSLDYLRACSSRKAVLFVTCCFCIGYISISMSQVQVDYRLSDAIKYGLRHIHVKNACKEFPHSILCEYESMPDPSFGSLVDITRRRMNTNVTSIHLRLGDGLGQSDCWTNSTHCKSDYQDCYNDVCDWNDQYILRKQHGYPHLATRRVFMPKALPKRYYDGIRPPLYLPVVLVVGTFRTRGQDDAYVRNAMQYWQERGYNVSVRLTNNADADFVYMASTRYFVQGGGGYSGYIAKVSTTLGHVVLRHHMARQCCATTGPFLCTNASAMTWL